MRDTALWGDKNQDYMEKYTLVTDNIISLERLISRGAPQENIKCYLFHLRKLREKQRKLLDVIEI